MKEKNMKLSGYMTFLGLCLFQLTAVVHCARVSSQQVTADIGETSPSPATFVGGVEPQGFSVGEESLPPATYNEYTSIKPIVSCDWLEEHLEYRNLTIIDVRTSEEYNAGHIQGAINIPFIVPSSEWITMKEDLLLELPEKNELLNTIGSHGLNKNSEVVIVATVDDPPYAPAGATRVADTLIYAGVKKAHILDGGYPKWVAEGKETTIEVPTITAVEYYSEVNTEMFVDRSYVESKVGKSIIIDARDEEVYLGKIDEPWTEGAFGHIPGAVSLPARLIWNADGTYKSRKELEEIVQDATENGEKNKEIIIYCGVGGYTSSWWYVLTQLLEYDNVKFYDGSAQEWIKYNALEI